MPISWHRLDRKIIFCTFEHGCAQIEKRRIGSIISRNSMLRAVYALFKAHPR